MRDESFTFIVDLLIRGFDCSPPAITETLGIEPAFALIKGSTVGPVIQKRSIWYGRVRTGSSDDEFAAALSGFLSLMEKREPFVRDLTHSGADVICIIRGDVMDDDGIVFQLNLEPDFLQRCGILGIGLQIEGWTREQQPAVTIALETQSASAG